MTYAAATPATTVASYSPGALTLAQPLAPKAVQALRNILSMPLLLRVLPDLLEERFCPLQLFFSVEFFGLG
jgi:hypothetical protein